MMDCHFCDDILQSLSPKFSFGLSLWISCQVDSFCFPRLARSFFHSDSVFYTCGILLVVNEISSQICHHVRWMPVWILQWNDGQKTKCLLCWVRNSNRLRRSFHPSIHLAQISNTRGHKARRNGVARLCYWSWNYCPLLALPLFSASDLPSNWYFHVALLAKSGSTSTCHCDNMRTFLQRLTDCDKVIAIMIRIAFLHEKFQPKKIGDAELLQLFTVVSSKPRPKSLWHPYDIGAGITARCWHSRRCWHQTCPPIDISTPPHWSKIAPSERLHIALGAGSSPNGPLCNTWAHNKNQQHKPKWPTTENMQDYCTCNFWSKKLIDLVP